uniref:Vascular endothelial zinc finger 1-like n=1 Tax=Sinocyclocheilus anshuiensis TaxID=1608454 RepID=A0A671LXD0_9TELE
MDAAWSNFLFQTPPSQSQTDATLQSDLLPELTDAAQDPPPEHIAPPPSTVDTAALSEEPVPVKPVTRPARPTHICSICNKQFKNSYNLRRHQSVHTGVKMKDRAAREKIDGSKAGARVERQTIPLSLLQLSIPASIPTALDQKDRSANSEHVLPTERFALFVALTTKKRKVIKSDILSNIVFQAAPNTNINDNLNNPTPIQISIPITNPLPINPTPNPNPNPNPVRKNHACEACGKAFRDVYHLNRHRLSHSDEKPYSCPICQQRFKRKDRMSYHVRSHQGGVEKPYVCPHCAKGFSRPDHLNSHVRQVHSTERPFKCPTCESAFATKDRLRAHMIRHEDKVPCHICGKLLSPAYITDHMRVHNQSQHHVCHLCNRSFTTLTYLRVHAQKHHGQEWKDSGVGRGSGPGGVLLCQLCGVQCKTPTQLQGHMATHANQMDPSVPCPISISSSSSSVATVGIATPVSSPPVTVGLLVTDCSSIAPQSHS